MQKIDEKKKGAFNKRLLFISNPRD